MCIMCKWYCSNNHTTLLLLRRVLLLLVVASHRYQHEPPDHYHPYDNELVTSVVIGLMLFACEYLPCDQHSILDCYCPCQGPSEWSCKRFRHRLCPPNMEMWGGFGYFFRLVLNKYTFLPTKTTGYCTLTGLVKLLSSQLSE